MSSSMMSFRIPDDLRAQLKKHCAENKLSEADVINTLLKAHFDSPQEPFSTYEQRYMKFMSDRTIYLIFLIIEHLSKQDHPQWDGALYHKTAVVDARKAQDKAASAASSRTKTPKKEETKEASTSQVEEKSKTNEHGDHER